MSEEQTDAVGRLVDIINANWMTQVVYAAAELRIADALAAGPLKSDEVARQLDLDGPFLHRLLLMLVSLDVCAIDDENRFWLTAMGELLRDDAEVSLRAWTLYWAGSLWPVLGRLADAVRTGKSGRELHDGMAAFEVLERDPEAAAIFNRAMVELTTRTLPDVVASVDIGDRARIVDVGGGYGQLLAALLEANPTASGVLVDRAHAVADAPVRMGDVAARCEFVVGDFFKSVPAGGDIYILKSILHDWPDEEATKIVAAVRAAMEPGARLLVIERVMPDRFEASPMHQSMARADLVMMIELASRERTETEFRAMLRAAGLEVQRVTPIVGGFHVIDSIASG